MPVLGPSRIVHRRPANMWRAKEKFPAPATARMSAKTSKLRPRLTRASIGRSSQPQEYTTNQQMKAKYLYDQADKLLEINGCDLQSNGLKRGTVRNRKSLAQATRSRAVPRTSDLERLMHLSACRQASPLLLIRTPKYMKDPDAHELQAVSQSPVPPYQLLVIQLRGSGPDLTRT